MIRRSFALLFVGLIALAGWSLAQAPPGEDVPLEKKRKDPEQPRAELKKDADPKKVEEKKTDPQAKQPEKADAPAESDAEKRNAQDQPEREHRTAQQRTEHAVPHEFHQEEGEAHRCRGDEDE